MNIEIQICIKMSDSVQEAETIQESVEQKSEFDSELEKAEKTIRELHEQDNQKYFNLTVNLTKKSLEKIPLNIIDFLTHLTKNLKDIEVEGIAIYTLTDDTFYFSVSYLKAGNPKNKEWGYIFSDHSYGNSNRCGSETHYNYVSWVKEDLKKGTDIKLLHDNLRNVSAQFLISNGMLQVVESDEENSAEYQEVFDSLRD